MTTWKCSGKYKSVDKCLDIISIVLIIFLCIITFIEWNNAPDIIPVHYNFHGEVDRIGSKNQLFFTLPVVVILYIGFFILAKYPQIYNYIVKITDKNREVQYNMAATLIRILNIEIVAMFIYVQLKEVNSIFYERGVLPWIFVPVVLVVLIGTIGIYIYKSLKNK